MSHVEELIMKTCPTGVDYLPIKEIATDLFRGSGIKRDDVTNEGIPCVRYGEIYTSYGIWFEKCISHTRLDKVQSPKYFEYGDILFAITGESIEDIAKSTAYVGQEKCLAGGDIVVLKHNQNPKFLSYVLSSDALKRQKRSGKVKSKVVHASIPSIEQLIVPIPPMSVQEEIVKILDEYSFVKNKLIDELKKEIEKREVQYNHYMNELLTFPDEKVTE